MKAIAKRYSSFLLVLVLLGVISLFNQELGTGVFNITVMQLKEMLLVIPPPIFVLLGLLDVWVPKQTMVKFMGKGSGLKGILLSLLIGSAAAGPLYGAFPVAAVFMKKGSDIYQYTHLHRGMVHYQDTDDSFRILSTGCTFCAHSVAYRHPWHHYYCIPSR